MTLNKTEQKIYNDLLAYQKGTNDDTRLVLGELSQSLTALFFGLCEILERGQDELPRTTAETGNSAYDTGYKDGVKNEKILAEYRDNGPGTPAFRLDRFGEKLEAFGYVPSALSVGVETPEQFAIRRLDELTQESDGFIPDTLQIFGKSLRELDLILAEHESRGKKPDDIRLQAAANSLLAKAYITGTKDGLAVASRLVERTIASTSEQLSAYPGIVEPLDAYTVMQLERRISYALSEETNRTEKAQEEN